METKLNLERRRSSNVSAFSYNTCDSGISVTSGFPYSAYVNHEVFVSKATGNGYPIYQSNGCMRFGPPLNYEGPKPGPECELFIKHFPRDNFECQLIPHFERFGEIYEFRLMKEFDSSNRGYAYIRFLKEEAAIVAHEVMKCFLLPNGTCLDVQKSYNKSRLFVSNLPKDKPETQIISVFKEMFPSMIKMTIHTIEQNNRAFAFMDFADHNAALEAKMKASPGTFNLFDREVTIAWAYPERKLQSGFTDDTRTLFIRNVGLCVNSAQIKQFLSQAVPIKAIKSISPVRDFAFVDFVDHESAKRVKEKLNGFVISSTPIDIEWARPPSENSIHNLKQTDYDHILRLKCIANYWEMPIYLYGRVFNDIHVQCASITIKSEKKTFHYFFEISYEGLIDIQSRIAEGVVNLIGQFGELPSENLVIKVIGDVFYVIGFMQNIKISPTFYAAAKFIETKIFFEEIFDLALMANVFENINSQDLYILYQSRVQNPEICEYIENITVNGRILGCVSPKIRQSSELPSGFSNHEMMFVLTCAFFKNNVYFFNKGNNQYKLTFFSKNGVIQNHHYIISVYLLPLRFIQSKRNGPTCKNVTFGNLSPNYPVIHQNGPQLFWMPTPPFGTFTSVYHPAALSPTHSMRGNTITTYVPAKLRDTHSNVF